MSLNRRKTPAASRNETREALLARAQHLMAELVSAPVSQDVEDALDEPQPWFAFTAADGECYSFTFLPDRFIARDYFGTKKLTARWASYDPQAVAGWLAAASTQSHGLRAC